MKYIANMFTPTQWDTAEQKAKFANRFVKFVENGFRACDFPKWFYQRLSNTFGHIAHYNQRGFWETFFTSTEGKIDFLKMVDNCPCYGDVDYTYSDVESMLRLWVRYNKFIEKYEEIFTSECREEEIAELHRLQWKYGKETGGAI